jgi:transcriptional regulator with XRE-family HTH domain
MFKFQNHKMAALRAFHGLEQAELAEKAGLSRGTIQKLEHGDIKNPSIETITSLAACFGVSITVLVSDEALVLE